MKIQFEGISVQNTVQCWHFREKRYLYISLSALSSNKSFLSLFKINVWYLLSTFQAPTWPKSQETNHNTLDWKRGIRSESSAVGQTYQAEDHLVEHRPQTPPVDCPVVRLFAKNLWCQVLRGTEEKAESQLAMFVKLIRRYLFLPLWWAPLYIYIYFFLHIFTLTSGVPQKVEVVPSGSTPSLHRPKSVSTTCPSRITSKNLFLTF